MADRWRSGWPVVVAAAAPLAVRLAGTYVRFLARRRAPLAFHRLRDLRDVPVRGVEQRADDVPRDVVLQAGHDEVRRDASVALEQVDEAEVALRQLLQLLDVRGQLPIGTEGRREHVAEGLDLLAELLEIPPDVVLVHTLPREPRGSLKAFHGSAATSTRGAAARLWT